MTVTMLFLKCWESYWDKPRFKQSGWAKEVEGYWYRHIEPTFGHLLCNKVSVAKIREWHQSLSGMPTTANRCLDVLSRLYTFAEEREYLPLGSNPCKLVARHPERKRTRYASEEELQKIGELLLSRHTTKLREVTFCYLLALTGARPRSIARARKDQLQRIGDQGVLRFEGKISATTGEMEMVVLPPQAMKLIENLPFRRDGLLIGPVAYRRFWEKIRKEAGCPDLWLRDLRRTFASVGLDCDVAIDNIGELLNHRSAQTTKLYARLLPQKRLASGRLIGERMGKLMGVRQ